MARFPVLKHARFITSILTIGALVAALSTAAPAQAADRDKVKAVVGTGLAIWMLHELNKNGQLKGNVQQAHGSYDRRYYDGRGQGYGQGHGQSHGGNRHGGGWSNDGHRGGQKTHGWPPLPRQCLRETRRQGLVLNSYCTHQNYRAVKALPNSCRTTYWSQGQRRNGYSYDCLRKSGFGIARR